MPRRSGADRDPPRGPSATKLILLILGGLTLLGVLACGGVIGIGYWQAQRKEAAILEELAANEREHRALEDEMRAAEDRGRPDGGLPDPADGKPVPDPAPQPAPTPLDGPDDKKWFVLFRGTDPANWNRTVDGGEFAVPVRCAPQNVTHLRLRRTDTGDAVIVPVQRPRLAAQAVAAGGAPRWNGEAKDEHGGRHLGIGHGKTAAFMEGKGLIAVVMDGFDATTGTGFGHAHHIDDGGQRQVWKGEEVKGVPFEIAVTAGDLTAKEKGQRLK